MAQENSSVINGTYTGTNRISRKNWLINRIAGILFVWITGRNLADMSQVQPNLTKYFWLANITFWLAVLGIAVHVQWGAELIIADKPRSWMHLWVLNSPWYLTWALLTAAIFSITRLNEQKNYSMRRKIVNHAAAAPLLLMAYFLFCVLCGQLLRGNGVTQYWESLNFIVRSSTQIDLAIYAGVLTVSLGLRFYHQSMHEKYEVKRLQNLLIQEQLKALRSQLNPHFLFNTLNTIASLVRLKREKQAIYALAELSTMLRTILENKDQKNIRIRDEISFINSYLAIQKMRFADKLDTYIHAQSDCLEIEIPNMLLQPLVENAVQHGSQLESNQNPLSVEISRLDDNLKIVMINKVAQNDKHNGFGIGLSNTRERLEKLYGQFRLELSPLKEGLFETVLTIPVGAKDA